MNIVFAVGMSMPDSMIVVETRMSAFRPTNVRITVDGLSNNLDPRLEVWLPDGTFESSTCSSPSNATCSFQHSFPATVAGTYYIAFSDSGLDNTGSVNVTLSCILGTCPTVLPATQIGQNYCTSTINSSGNAAVMSALGS